MAWPSFYGYIAEQSSLGLDLIKEILEENTDILRVVELGTGHGGMSLFLGTCVSPRSGRVLTIDRVRIMDRGFDAWNAVAQGLGVSFLQGDVFSPETVRAVSEFTRGHRALIFCDDGDKKREVALYTEVLKSGDLLMAHDYDGFSLADLTERTLALLAPYRQEPFSQGTTTLSMIRR